jgi:hypothetical protein
MLKLWLTISLIFIISTGCSSKKYFEPKDTIAHYNVVSHNMSKNIKSINKDGGTLEDFRIINKNGISKDTLPLGYFFLNKSNDIIISANKQKQLFLSNMKDSLTFKRNIISATLKDNLLALVFANNSVAIFNIKSKQFKFKEYQKPSSINDHRIANPIFLDDIILFPTLNGSIIIVSNKTFKVIKTIKIDINNQVNNIIFLETIDDALVAATTNKILVLGDDLFNIQKYNIKDIISHNKYIYLATLDGKVIKLDLTLDVVAQTKLKFAKISTLGFGTKLYALESQEYLIEFNDNLSKTKVYNFNFDNTKKTIIIGDTLYFDNKYIKLK